MNRILILAGMCLAQVLPIASGISQWISRGGPNDVFCFAVDAERGLWLGSRFEGVYRSLDGGDSWILSDTGLTNKHINTLMVTPRGVFAGTRGGIFLSTDGGSLWAHSDGGIDTSVAANEVMALARVGTYLFAGMGGNGVYRSSDEGVTWSQASSGLDENYIWSMAAVGNDIFAGTDKSIYISQNSASTWTQVNLGLPTSPVYAITSLGSILIIGTDKGVYTLTNVGSTWQHKSLGRPNEDVWSVVVDSARVFTANYGYGVFRSDDSCSTWHDVSTGLTNLVVWRIVMVTHATRETDLLVGTNGSGVWQRPHFELLTAVDDHSGMVPQAFLLSQNYPNPFNPNTIITYELPKLSEVRLGVYDMLGREVSVLVNDRREAGVHEVQFDGSGFAGGVYFYRLQTGDFMATKWLLLLK